MPTPQWEPAEVLRLDPYSSGFTCIGYAPSKGRRCRNPIACANRQDSAKILLEMSRLDPQSQRVDDELEDLASRLLCRRWHQDQALDMKRQWRRNIESYRAAETARLRERTEYLVQLLFTAAEVRAERSSTVRAERSSTVQAERSSPVRAERSSAVQAQQSSTVQAERSSAVRAEQSSTVRAERSSAVQAQQSSTVQAQQSSTVQAERSSAVRAEQSSTTQVEHSSIVRAERSSTVQAERSSAVRAEQSSTVRAEQSSTTQVEHSSIVRAERSSIVQAERPSTVRTTPSLAPSTLAQTRATTLRIDQTATSVVHLSIHVSSSATLSITTGEEPGRRENNDSNEGESRRQTDPDPNSSSPPEALPQETNQPETNPSPIPSAANLTTPREEAANATSSEAPIPEPPTPSHHSHDRRPIQGDCSICFEDLSSGGDTVWCRAQCRQNLHAECASLWLASQEAIGRVKTCPYCRAQWAE
ncbi:hypothetical protein HO133_002948 [Letharia lupina]|uniref:RING-type domain-containing protein n=1 Tax=Letharia lupina TaxID=560253 RepID=A0A8H6CBH5_9LECA|nr:uncharacterized protein HO133_002948 [Letharia lupina]KAF6220515.1 hypothetical protein HO133_002948 [Letharia lupina]